MSIKQTFNLMLGSLLYLLFIQGAYVGQAQNAHQVGIPVLRNYAPKEYKGHRQVWAIVQDKQGKMYFGTTEGLLEHDGRNWRILIPGKMVRSLALAPDGTIYVGQGNDFGYLTTNSLGQVYYQSLLPQLPKADRKITDVWYTYTTSHGVYFMTNEILCRFIHRKLEKTWRKSKQRDFWSMAKVNDIVYINTRTLKSTGNRKFNISKVAGNILQPLKLPEQLHFKCFWSCLPYKENKILIIQRNYGIWCYDPTTQKTTPLNTHLNEQLKDFDVYSATKLPNGNYALSSTNKGIVIINEQGEIINEISKEQGLIDNVVWCLYCSPNTHDLWIGTNEGISKLTVNTPITFFGEHNGPQGVPEDVYNYQGLLFVNTSTGCFKLRQNKFIRVKGLHNSTWNAISFKPQKGISKLLVANHSGMYEIKDTIAERVFWEDVVSSLHSDRQQPTKVYAGLQHGLCILQYQQGQWVSITPKIPDFNYGVRDILQDGKDRLWLATEYNGIGLLKNNQVVLFDEKAGLPATSFPNIGTYNDQIYVTTRQGIYTFNEQTQRMQPGYTFEKLFGYQGRIIGVAYDATRRYFAVQDSVTKQWAPYKKTANHTFTPDNIVWSTIQDTANLNILDINSEGIYWIYNQDGLFRYNAKQTFQPQRKYHTLIRSVHINNDSLVYAGRQQKQRPIFEQGHNSFVFHYASPYFTRPEQILYSYQLLGYDKDWSKWGLATKKEYSNLREGNYSFRVKAKNIYGIESLTAIYHFKVLPPWYRTWWAYTLYIVGSILLISLVAWLNSLRLIKQKNALELIVQERTEEIQSQNEEIQNQNEAITRQNQLLTKKSYQIHQSIKAAKVIQEAILPFEQLMKQQLKEHFVIYRPKDVVSGDFYWIHQLEDKQIIGVIDCTGHGVPGAFTSMIGYTLLNKIIKEQKLTCPKQILEQLRTEIHHSLRQNQTNNYSGMDAVFVTLEPQANGQTKVHFAGAKRPLWYIDKESKQVEVIEGSRVSIGITYSKSRAIAAQTILCNKGTLLYLSTDGFMDQNNAGRKKLGQQLLDFVYDIRQEPLPRQQQLLEQLLDRQLIDTEQRDDILMIGLKLS